MVEWSLHTKHNSENNIRFSILENGIALSFKKVFELFVSSESFCTFYSNLLRNHIFEAYAWEHPKLSYTNFNAEYECSLVKSPGLLNSKEDLKPFEKYFDNYKSTTVFKNLSGDATLVVPCPLNHQTEYTHLASFIRTASKSQIIEFWKTVGIATQQLIQEQDLWLSTAGLGVSWLHVRLDNSPKYFRTLDYK